jgi:deazaflavin-dependent oxidoreductase (nitroreductase family)
MKLKIVHAIQIYLLNPPIKLAFRLGIVPPSFVLLETIGRKSGQPRRTPVGDGRIGNTLWIVAEHGRRAGYVLNLSANPRVRVGIRKGLRQIEWIPGTATVLPDDSTSERLRRLGALNVGQRVNAWGVRMWGTDLLTVRIDLDEPAAS